MIVHLVQCPTGPKPVWIAGCDHFHRLWKPAALHRPVADDLLKQAHAIAGVDLIEEQYVLLNLAIVVHRRAARNLSKDVVNELDNVSVF